MADNVVLSYAGAGTNVLWRSSDESARTVAGAVEFPSVERFVVSYVAGSPPASHVSQASDVARKNLTADTERALEKYVGNRGLSFPIAAHLLTATA